MDQDSTNNTSQEKENRQEKTRCCLGLGVIFFTNELMEIQGNDGCALNWVVMVVMQWHRCEWMSLNCAFTIGQLCAI